MVFYVSLCLIVLTIFVFRFAGLNNNANPFVLHLNGDLYTGHLQLQQQQQQTMTTDNWTESLQSSRADPSCRANTFMTTRTPRTAGCESRRITNNNNKNSDFNWINYDVVWTRHVGKSCRGNFTAKQWFCSRRDEGRKKYGLSVLSVTHLFRTQTPEWIQSVLEIPRRDPHRVCRNRYSGWPSAHRYRIRCVHVSDAHHVV